MGKISCGLPVVKFCGGTACVMIRATILRVPMNTTIDIGTDKLEVAVLFGKM